MSYQQLKEYWKKNRTKYIIGALSTALVIDLGVTAALLIPRVKATPATNAQGQSTNLSQDERLSKEFNDLVIIGSKELEQLKSLEDKLDK